MGHVNGITGDRRQRAPMRRSSDSAAAQSDAGCIIQIKHYPTALIDI